MILDTVSIGTYRVLVLIPSYRGYWCQLINIYWSLLKSLVTAFLIDIGIKLILTIFILCFFVDKI